MLANLSYTAWPKRQLGDLLTRIVKPLKVESNAEYREIGIRSHCKGIFHKSPVTGKQLGSKRVFWVEPGCLVLNIVFAWEQAVAVTGQNERGMIASHRFPMYQSIDGQLFPEYALLYFSSPQGKYNLGLASPGGAGRNKTLGQEEFRRLKIPVPPPEYQQFAIRAMRTWDMAIAQTEKLIEAKLTLKKGLMQQLLTGKRRFKEFVKSKETRRTKYGELPADWDLVCIHDIADVNKRSLPNATEPDYEFFYIDLSAVKEGTVDFPNTRIRFGEAPSRARRIVASGDVIMATVRPNLKGFALADFNSTDTICSTGFALISPYSKTDSLFIYENLYSDLVSQQIHGLLVGSNYPAINSSDVENLNLFYPTDKDEREQISKILAGIENEIQNLHLCLQALQEQKRGLMQKLLTGQIRVKATCEVL